jgi:hypothetical protein
MTVLDAADGLSTGRGRQHSYDRFWHKCVHAAHADESVAHSVMYASDCGFNRSLQHCS